MGRKQYSLACILCCAMFVWSPHGVAHALHPAGVLKLDESALSASLSSLPSALLPAGHARQRREEQGQKQLVTESHPQQDAGSAPLTECVPPSSCDYSPSFMQTQVNAATDVSCFPHDRDIGSTTVEFDQKTAATVVECLAHCRASSKCSHFTWNKHSRKCHLKADPPVFYNYVGDVTGPRSCDTTCFVGCLTYNTTPIRTLDWTDQAPALCQSACWALSDCQAFVIDNGKCKLFGKGFSAYRAVSGGNTIAGPKNLCELPSDLRLAELLDGHRIGSCLKSDNIGSVTPEIPGTASASSVAVCQQRCQNNSRCNHFTYSLHSKLCFMKEKMPPQYYLVDDDITGDKMCKPE